MPRLAREEWLALLSKFRGWLVEQHLPVTRQRDRIAEIIFSSDDHLSADGVARKLRERGDRVGTATVYRTLDVLVQSGLVRVHDFGEGFKRYEPVPTRETHEHLLCTRCGAVVEFANERMERILPIIAEEHGFQLQRHEVKLFGVCQECRKRTVGEIGR